MFNLRIITDCWHSHKLLWWNERSSYLCVDLSAYKAKGFDSLLKGFLLRRCRQNEWTNTVNVFSSLKNGSMCVLIDEWQRRNLSNVCRIETWSERSISNWSKTNYSLVEYQLPCLFIKPTRRSMNEWINKWRMLSFFFTFFLPSFFSILSLGLSLSFLSMRLSPSLRQCPSSRFMSFCPLPTFLAIFLNERTESVNSLMAFFHHRVTTSSATLRDDAWRCAPGSSTSRDRWHASISFTWTKAFN